VTLTYSPQNIPPYGSLRIRDWQLFAKRLRKKIGPFRFFHCGEYGTETGRPHYHACIFGVDFSGDRQHFATSKGNRIYRSPLLEDTWALGHTSVGDLTYESAAYVARYTLKKVTGEKADDHYARIDPDTGEVVQIQPEYVTMSRNPGIGKGWFDRYRSDVFPEDEVILAGRRFRTPRFYDNLIDDDELKSVKKKRLDNMAKRGKDLTPERLIQRHEHAILTAKNQKRTL